MRENSIHNKVEFKSGFDVHNKMEFSVAAISSLRLQLGLFAGGISARSAFTQQPGQRNTRWAGACVIVINLKTTLADG